MIRLPSGLVIEANASLKPLTSWLVGGPADYLALPTQVQELKEAVAWAHLKGMPVTLLSGGTNVLVSDKGIRGLTICLRKFAGTTPGERKDETGQRRFTLECLAGTSKSELLKTFLKQKLEPALFLAGIPGDVGGGVVMNAGIGEKYVPREFVEITDWIEVLRAPNAQPMNSSSRDLPSDEEVSNLASSLKLERIEAKNLTWSYRHCEGWRPGVITRVGLSWPLEAKDDILPRVKSANQVRLSKQPLDMPSCGSVFVNPPGTSSGRVVEACGLKGFAVGGAKVSEKHANFIVNFNEATAMDIHKVITKVRETVATQQGITLKTEVVYLGDWDLS